MSYLSKKTILSAYKVLSTISADPTTQGATQRISAVRYLLALDMFYKAHNRPCDTRDSEDAAEFIEYVGRVVAVNERSYTSNFHTPLKSNADYAVGSNFYSVNVVRESTTNGGDELEFPRRGQTPIMRVRSGKLYEDKSLLPNLKSFIFADEHKTALVLWLLRGTNLGSDPFYVEAQRALANLFTQDLINELLVSAQIFTAHCNKIGLSFSDKLEILEDNEITGLFRTAKNEVERVDIMESSLQKIFFGTPGSGKSNTVKKLVAEHEEDTFRTTFHPDTDYASFVGSYKPVMISPHKGYQRGKILTQQELTNILRERFNRAAASRLENNNSTVLQFGIEYHGYFNGKIASYSKQEVVNDAIPGTSWATELNKAVNIGPWVEAHYGVEDNSCGEISYEFVPQAFTDAYVRAWQNCDSLTESPVYLVIEEINRGNCAQIFGDLFQLLDRKADGSSEYPVKADKDLRKHLERDDVLGPGHPGIEGGDLRLPANLHILATMNTSDQSLFPMDSAFKRRWDWEYVPIDPNNPASQFTVTIGDRQYAWKDFLIAANERIKDLTESEDKQMGGFFITRNVDEQAFKSKVMFYLWSEVCKEEYRSRSFFRSKTGDGKETEFSFNELFEKDDSGHDKGTALLQGFMTYLGVAEKPVSTDAGDTPEEENA